MTQPLAVLQAGPMQLLLSWPRSWASAPAAAPSVQQPGVWPPLRGALGCWVEDSGISCSSFTAPCLRLGSFCVRGVFPFVSSPPPPPPSSSCVFTVLGGVFVCILSCSERGTLYALCPGEGLSTPGEPRGRPHCGPAAALLSRPRGGWGGAPRERVLQQRPAPDLLQSCQGAACTIAGTRCRFFHLIIVKCGRTFQRLQSINALFMVTKKT